MIHCYRILWVYQRLIHGGSRLPSRITMKRGNLMMLFLKEKSIFREDLIGLDKHFQEYKLEILIYPTKLQLSNIQIIIILFQ